MLTGVHADKPNKKVKLTKSITSPSGKASYIRGDLNSDGQVSPLADQQSLMTLSKANCLITIGEKEEKLSSGDSVNIIKLNQDRR
jgi:molybdopterin biosynthesis enzyme